MCVCARIELWGEPFTGTSSQLAVWGIPHLQFLYAFCEAWAGSFSGDFCWYPFKGWGHWIVRSLFAPSCRLCWESLYGNCTKNWSFGQTLWFFFTVCHGNELVHLHWNLHTKIWNVVFGTSCHGWLKIFFQSFVWHWMWSSLHLPFARDPPPDSAQLWVMGLCEVGLRNSGTHFLWVYWNVLIPLHLAHQPFHPIDWERSFRWYGLCVHTCWSGCRI